MADTTLRQRIEAVSNEKQKEILGLLQTLNPEQRQELRSRIGGTTQQESVLPDFSRAIPVDSSITAADISASFINEQELSGISVPPIERRTQIIPASTNVALGFEDRATAEHIRQFGTLEPPYQSV